MKKFMLLIIILLIFFILFCVKFISIDPTEKVVSNKNGNSTGNIVNNAFIAKQGDWLYLAYFKIKTDGTHKKKYTFFDAPQSINVVGDAIYYRSSELLNEGAYLHKKRLNGFGKRKLTDDRVSEIQVVEDWLYYQNNSDHDKIYRIKTNGTNRTKVNDDISHNINVVDDWIYYNNITDGNKLFKVKIDGTERTDLNINLSPFSKIVVGGDWIYYTIDEDSQKVLRKVKTDGANDTFLSKNKSFGYLNFSNNYLFYTVPSKGSGQDIFKMTIDGDSITQLASSDKMDGYGINVIDDWIYYKKDRYSIYKLKIDGSQHIPIDTK